MTIPLALSRKQEIDQIVSEAESALRPIVKRIFWEIGPDWSGDWSITLKIVLSNDASRPKNLSKSAGKVEAYLAEKLRPDDLGVIDYYFFRSESEQAALGKQAWK